MDLLTQTSAILSQGAELMKNPAVGTAVTGMFTWMKDLFKNNKRAQERLELIEKSEANESTINDLKTNLDDLLYNNEELKKQLEEQVTKVEKMMEKAGVQSNVSKTNVMKDTGDNSQNFQDVNVKGNFSINK